MNWLLFQNSLFVSAASCAAALLLGIAAALFSISRSALVQKMMLACAVFILALPPFLVTNTWMHYFGIAGVWRKYFDWDVYSLSGVIALISLSLWPISFLLFHASLAAIPRQQFDVDPALRGFKLLRWVAVPALRNVLPLAAAATFVLAFNNFPIPTLLQVKVYPAELWLRFNIGFNFSEAAKLSWPLALGPILLLAVARSNQFKLHAGAFAGEGLWSDRVGFPLLIVTGCASMAAILLSAGLPMFQLASAPRTFIELLPAIEAGKSALANSVTIASLGALGALALAIFTSRLRAAGAAAWMLFLAPGVVLGIAIVYIFNRPATNLFYQSLGVVILGLTLRYMAPAWSGWKMALQSIPAQWKEISVIYKAGAWKEWRYLTFPALRRSFFALFFISYILCLWDVETLIFFVPAGKETLSIRIFNMLHFGHADQVNALCVVMLAAAGLPLVLFGAAQLALRLKKQAWAALVCLALLGAGCGGKQNTVPEFKSEFFS
jgi:iron(III) transport system permease protein